MSGINPPEQFAAPVGDESDARQLTRIDNAVATPEGTTLHVDLTKGTQRTERAGKRVGTPFTSESARAASVRRAEVARERKAAAAAQLAEDRLSSRQRLGLVMSEMTLDQLRIVRNKLVEQAQSGDVKSIHALARLLDQAFGRAKEEAATPQGADMGWEEMSPAQQSAYLAAILEEQRAAREELDGIESATESAESASAEE